jgi:diguanylate cyclase (GGDEF)-like protein
MKRLVPAIAVILGWTWAAWAAAPATLTTVSAIHNLTKAEASKGLPVAFEATVTYSRVSEKVLFVQDGGLAIYVSADTDAKLVPGDRVLVEGRTQVGFSADVASDRLTLLHRGEVPKPIPSTFDELIQVKRDCMLVTVHGVVRAIDMEQRNDVRNASLPRHSLARVQLLMDGGYVEIFVDTDDASALSGLLDSEVEITGVAGIRYDGKMEPTGVQLYVSSPADVKILKSAAVSPLSLPVMPMDQILSSHYVRDLTQRVHVQGTITYYEPGRAVVLQNGSKSLWIDTRTRNTQLELNDEVDATGFPDTESGFLVLTYAEIRNRNVQAIVQPLPVTWKKLVSSSNLFDLVSIEGEVVTEVREGLQDEYVLSSGGNLFTAILSQPEEGPAPMKQIPQGSRIRVTGICILGSSNPFNAQVPFNILMRSSEDIVVVAKPSLLNTQNLILLVGFLLVVVAVVGVWGWVLGRRMRRQTVAMSARTEAEAELERRRSRILEDINGTKPLADILEQIAELISFSLDGASCWCEIADGARLGKRPSEPHKLRVVPAEIPARSGPALGTLFAAFNAKTTPRPSEDEALFMGTRLATLAIETRRLYYDLHHRSEFDLLTDVHNRFSLEKRLNAQIDEARQNAGIFGLIYIDLDKFKQVNDLYGHHIGDLYLQEVTLRLKRQLRPRDLLARLGGDEFAVLLPTVRNRAGVDEVVRRLEHSFNDPFVLEGHTMQGTASFGIALYPEDSTTGDSLLNAADSAMYEAKNSKRGINKRPAQNPAPELAREHRD